MDEDLRRQIEELKQYLASVDPEYRKEWLKALYGGGTPKGWKTVTPNNQIITPHLPQSATSLIEFEKQLIEFEKQRSYAEARIRKMEDDRRAAEKQAMYQQWMQEYQAQPIPSPPSFRPTPEMMAQAIHQARCEIIAMTIMGDLYAK